MQAYNVFYIDKGNRKKQLVEAKSPEDAKRQMQRKGYVVIRVKQQTEHRVKRFPLGLFIQEMVALLDAGLVVTEAIEALQASTGEGQTRHMLEGLLKKLQEGCQLSQAMASQPDIFPELLINTVASSEQTGYLAKALKRYQYYEQRIEKLRKRIRATLTYPIIVLSAGALIMSFLLVYIIPSFSPVLIGSGNPSANAQFIIWWGTMVNESGRQLFLGALLAIASIIMLIRQQRLRSWFLMQLLRIPVLRKLQQLSILVRFYRTLGLLLDGGVHVIRALVLAQSVLPESHHPQLQNVLDSVQAGQALSTSLEKEQLTTPVATRLLQVGEQSGELADICESIAAFYDEALERAIDTFSKFFEPILMLIVGGIVGLVVFLLYMPIFEMAGGIS